MTTIERFRASAAEPLPPAPISPALEALWWAHKGDWDRAHFCVQQHEGDLACDLVHAHLHRQEGNLANASNWYRGAGREVPTSTLQEEWNALATEMLPQDEAAQHVAIQQ